MRLSNQDIIHAETLFLICGIEADNLSGTLIFRILSMQCSAVYLLFMRVSLSYGSDYQF